MTLEQISELGFSFMKAEDSVYKKQYGIDYWIVSKRLAKRITIDYDIATCKARLIRCDKEGTILKSRNIATIGELTEIVKFWEDKK